MSAMLNKNIIESLDRARDVATLTIEARREQKTNARDFSESVTKILLLGDLALARGIADRIDEHGMAFPMSKCVDDLDKADLICFNLECCLSREGAPVDLKPVIMAGEEKYLGALPFRPEKLIACLANNHFLDLGESAAKTTVKVLEQAGIKYFGVTGSHVRQQPLIVDIGKDGSAGQIAFIASSPCGHPIPNAKTVNLARPDLPEMKRLIARARELADVVVVQLHQGIEYYDYPHPDDRQFCINLAKAGADLIVVHHPHVVQGIEAVGDSLIFHSIGNFLIDLSNAHRPRSAEALGIELAVRDGKICDLQLQPFAINHDLQPFRMVEEDAIRFFNRLRHLSAAIHDPRIRTRVLTLAYLSRIRERIGSAAKMIADKGLIDTTKYYTERLKHM